MRDISSGLVSKSLESHVVEVILLVFELDDITLRFSSTDFDIRADLDDGNGPLKYTGFGDLIQYNPSSESTLLSVSDLDIVISGVPQANISLVFDTNFQFRPCRLYYGYISEDNVFVDTPMTLFSGLINTSGIKFGSDSGEAKITVNVQNKLARWEKSVGSRFTDAEQKRLFPGDTGLSRVSSLVDKELVWPKAD